MRVLVLGANGMLGHRLVRRLAEDVEVWGTARRSLPAGVLGIPDSRIVEGLVAESAESLMDVLARVRPEAVVNCIGIVKQRAEAKDRLPSIEVNARFPHRLKELCGIGGIRVVHLSTDCVFSGDRGGYVEADVADAADLYGRSKHMGEVEGSGCLTIRTSMIGWQIAEPTGLLEWFAANRGGRVKGFRGVRFSGLSTAALSDVVARTLLEWPDVDGLRHVSAEGIDKSSLLRMAEDALGWHTVIDSVDEPVLDRTLDSERFRKETGWAPPSWAEMVAGLAAEWPAYEAMRR